MEEMKNFNSNLFGELSVIMRDGEPWFIGSEVTQILGYKNPTRPLQKNVLSENKYKLEWNKIADEFKRAKMTRSNKEDSNAGGRRFMTIVNEAGFYQLVLKSKHPNAIKFQQWVCSEVLPTIRKHGAYISKELLEQCDNDPTKLERLFNSLKRENKILQNRVESLTDVQKLPTRRELKYELDLQTVSLKQLANQNGIHVMHLRQILLDNDVIHPCDTHYRLTDNYKELGTAVKHFDNEKGDWVTYFVFFDTDEVRTLINTLIAK